MVKSKFLSPWGKIHIISSTCPKSNGIYPILERLILKKPTRHQISYTSYYLYLYSKYVLLTTITTILTIIILCTMLPQSHQPHTLIYLLIFLHHVHHVTNFCRFCIKKYARVIKLETVGIVMQVMFELRVNTTIKSC